MKKGFFALIVLWIALASGCAPIQWQHPSHNDPEILNRDNYECQYRAKMYGMAAGTHYDQVNSYASTGTQMGQMFANIFANTATQAAAARGEYINCMTSLGYYQANIQTASVTPRSYIYRTDIQPSSVTRSRSTLARELEERRQYWARLGTNQPPTKQYVEAVALNEATINKAFEADGSEGTAGAPSDVNALAPTIVEQPRTSVSNAASKLEYWSWGLGVAVRTDEKTTITEFDDVGYSTAKKVLKLGDEIITIGALNIDRESAYKLLTKPLPTDKDGTVTVVVWRAGEEIKCQVKPND